MLSKENYDRLDTNNLYKKEPDDRDAYTYHCKNWTFRVYKNDDDNMAYMLDTYFNSWDSHKIKVTDENIDEFKIVFDFRKVEQTNYPEEYENKDIYCVATNSGGHSCGGLHWVNKGAKKSKQKLINQAQEKVESAKSDLAWAEKELQQLLDGTHYKLNR